MKRLLILLFFGVFLIIAFPSSPAQAWHRGGYFYPGHRAVFYAPYRPYYYPYYYPAYYRPYPYYYYPYRRAYFYPPGPFFYFNTPGVSIGLTPY